MQPQTTNRFGFHEPDPALTLPDIAKPLYVVNCATWPTALRVSDIMTDIVVAGVADRHGMIHQPCSVQRPLTHQAIQQGATAFHQT